MNRDFSMAIFWILILLGFIFYIHVVSAQIGSSDYQIHCASCHGDKGYGDGPDAHKYSPRPRNLVKDPFIQGDSEDQIVSTIKHGFNQMPPFYYLTDDERHDIAIYVRGFRK